MVCCNFRWRHPWALESDLLIESTFYKRNNRVACILVVVYSIILCKILYKSKKIDTKVRRQRMNTQKGKRTKNNVF